jgi:hypothetical protein
MARHRVAFASLFVQPHPEPVVLCVDRLGVGVEGVLPIWHKAHLTAQ